MVLSNSEIFDIKLVAWRFARRRAEDKGIVIRDSCIIIQPFRENGKARTEKEKSSKKRERERERVKVREREGSQEEEIFGRIASKRRIFSTLQILWNISFCTSHDN